VAPSRRGALCAVGLEVCGDGDGYGTVTASDVLRVLRRAVGQTVVLQCPDCS